MARRTNIDNDGVVAIRKFKRTQNVIGSASEVEYRAFEIATNKSIPSAIRREAAKCNNNLARGLMAAQRLHVILAQYESDDDE